MRFGKVLSGIALAVMALLAAIPVSAARATVESGWGDESLSFKVEAQCKAVQVGQIAPGNKLKLTAKIEGLQTDDGESVTITIYVNNYQESLGSVTDQNELILENVDNKGNMSRAQYWAEAVFTHPEHPSRKLKSDYIEVNVKPAEWISDEVKVPKTEVEDPKPIIINYQGRLVQIGQGFTRISAEKALASAQAKPQGMDYGPYFAPNGSVNAKGDGSYLKRWKYTDRCAETAPNTRFDLKVTAKVKVKLQGNAENYDATSQATGATAAQATVKVESAPGPDGDVELKKDIDASKTESSTLTITPSGIEVTLAQETWVTPELTIEDLIEKDIHSSGDTEVSSKLITFASGTVSWVNHPEGPLLVTATASGNNFDLTKP